MGIKWLGKSHRSPVSCKEISREQVANRLQSRCKQGFKRREDINKSIIIVCLLNLLAWKASWAHRTGENEKKNIIIK